jgi:hypothetical protein
LRYWIVEDVEEMIRDGSSNVITLNLRTTLVKMKAKFLFVSKGAEVKKVTFGHIILTAGNEK